MDASSKQESLFNSLDLIRFVIRWKWVLLAVFIFSAIAAAIFSSTYFISPLYKSEVIMYPSTSNSISRTLVSNNSTSNDLLKFGEEEQTEQMLQLLNSNLIKDRIIAKYDLLSHYGIQKDSRYHMTQLYKEYESNFKFSRTEYMAVQIIVWDEDPKMAADMANDIVTLVDSIKTFIQKKRAVKGYEIVEKEYNVLLNEMKIKEDSLTGLRKLGIHDYETQAEMINQQLAIELAAGNLSAVKRLEERLDVLAEYGTAYVSLREGVQYDIGQLSTLKSKLNEARIDAQEVLPQNFIVNKAFKAEKKSYPVRWLIVVLSCFSATLLSFIILLFIEQLSKIDLTIKEN